MKSLRFQKLHQRNEELQMARKVKFKKGDSINIAGYDATYIVSKDQYLFRNKPVVDVENFDKRVSVSIIQHASKTTIEPATETNANNEPGLVAAAPQRLLNKYQREITNACGQSIVTDVYDILNAYTVTDPAIAHAIKKLLMPGQRGDKSIIADLNESIQAISRSLDVHYIKEARS